jgi:hypothetical protein
MGLADELRKLQELRDAGTLSDEEFAQAKAAMLRNPPATPAEQPPAPVRSDSLGDAAKTWVNFQIGMAVVGVILFLIMLFAVILPAHREFDRKWEQGPFGGQK